jgi:hypothetical protein
MLPDLNLLQLIACNVGTNTIVEMSPILYNGLPKQPFHTSPRISLKQFHNRVDDNIFLAGH